MSSVGQVGGGIIGATIGFFTGGPMGAVYGAQIGMTAGALIDPPKGPTINGPRLSDLSVQTSTYGAHIPRVYGAVALTGNVIWLEGNKLKEVVKKQSSGGKGGGGGSTTRTYSYYATFAVGLCKGPIGGVRRIWIGSKLIYDASAPTTTNYAHVYLGTDTQQPDPRMQADRGVANTPAYRGLAYIVFYDYPLADHGNSLLGAQVKVETLQATTTSNQIIGLDLSTDNTYVETFVYNPLLNEIWCTNHSPNGLTRLNADTGAIVGHVPAPGMCYGAIRYDPIEKRIVCASATGLYVFDAWASRYLRSVVGLSGNNYLYIVNDPPITRTRGTWSRTTGYVADPGGYWVGFGGANANATNGEVKKLSSTGEVLETYAVGVAPLRMVLDRNGRVWMIRWARGFFGAADYVRLSCLTPGEGLIEDYSIPYVPNDSMVYDFKRDSLWITVQVGTPSPANKLLEFSVATRGFGSPRTLPYEWTFTDEHNPLAYDAARGMVWIGTDTGMLMGMDTSTGAVTSIDIGTTYGVWTGAHIEVVNGAIWVSHSGFGPMVRISFGVSTPVTVTLGDIVSAESLQTPLLSAVDIDVTELTQIVRGYRITQTGAIRGGLDSLQAAWPFDVVQAGYKIRFRMRGTSPVATVAATELDAREGSAAPGTQITLAREMDSQVPRRLTLTHMDPAREYDTGEQSAERLNVDSISVKESELPIVLTATEAAQIAERLLHLYWLERTDVGPFRLPPTYLGLEPADVITVQLLDATYQLRLVSVQYLPDGRLECSAKLDAAAVYSPTALGDGGDASGAVITMAGPTRAVLLDLPTMRQQDSVPGFSVAVTGYLPAWPGGVIYRSPDGGQTWDDLAATLPPGATIGAASNSIGAGRTDIIDTVNTLTVMVNHTLQSVTEMQLLGGTNHYAYGADGRWEVIGAQYCDLQGDGSWVLSNLLRGRFGTEWAMTTHQAGDTVVALSADSLNWIPSETGAIGLGTLYRAITAGAALDSDYDTAFAYQGVNLECLSPVYLNGDRHPTTRDWTLTWIRRTRIGGEWRDYVDATLGQTLESYEIDIFSDATYTTVKRTITATSASVAYTSAQQVTDFGSNQGTLYVKVYQMSDVVGRGYPLTTSITRG